MDVRTPELYDLDAALRTREQRYQSVFARTPVPMWIFDPDSLGILAVNEAALSRYGYSRDEFLRLTLRDLRPREELGALWRARTAMVAGEEVHGVFRHVTKHGEIFDVEIRTTILGEGGGRFHLAMAFDVSEHRRAADVACYLDHASSLFTSTFDRGMIGRSVASLAATRLGDWCAVHWGNEHGGVELGGFAHGNPLDEPLLHAMLRGRDVARPGHPVAEVLRSGRALVLGPGEHGALVLGEAGGARPRSSPHLRLAARAAMYIPIRGAERLHGVLECVAATDERAASVHETALAEELAVRAARALDNALRYEQARREHVAPPRAGSPILPSPGAPAGDPSRDALLLSFLERIPDGFLVVDEDWCFTHVNQAAERILGLPREELLGRAFWSAFPRLEGTTFEREYRRAMATRGPTAFEAYYAELDAWYDVTVQPLPTGLGIFFRDTSARHRAEEERAAAERVLFEHAELTTELIHVIRADGSIIYANRAWREALGYDLATLRRLTIADVVAPEWHDAATDALRRAVQGEEVRDLELEVVAADGQRLRVRGGGSAWAVPGRPPAVFGAMRTVAAAPEAGADARAPHAADGAVVQRVAEVSLQEQLDSVLHELAGRAADLGVTVETAYPGEPVTLRGDPVRVRQLLRYVLDHVVRSSAHGRVQLVLEGPRAPDRAPVLRAHGSGTTGGGLGITIARSMCTALGFDLRVESGPGAAGTFVIRFAHAEPHAARATPAAVPAVDLADPGLAELLHVVVHASPLGVVVYDTELRVRLWSDSAARMFGWTAEEVVGERFPIVPDEEVPQLRELLRRAVEEGGVTEASVRRRHKDGRILDAHSSIAPLRDMEGRVIGFVTLIADVTERNRLEAQLRQAQKMELVGQLAGGIAHDFNNLLTVISANAWFLLDALPAGDPRRRDAEEINAAAGRAASLTRQLLVFARKGVPERRVIDLRATVHDTERMLRRLIGSNIELGTLTPDEPCLVLADPGQLEQILMNLAVNARDAMPNGGAITIEASRVTGPVAPDGVPRGHWVVLAVTDTGTGISPDVRERMFDPFFTTKEAGQGTGLGLSIVQTIVSDAGGRVAVDSTPGGGTTFRIYLPQAGDDLTMAAPVAAERPAQGSGTVLVVEDQDALRRVVTRALTAAGYDVLTARHAADALEVAAGHPDRIDVLVTDIVMPGMDGLALVERIRQQRPGIRAVVMSGYSERLQSAPPDAVYVQKPFTTAELASAVQRALDPPG